jgi:hypothetical protein
VVLVAALILWGGISLFHSAAGSKTTAGQTTAKAERTLTLVALDAVHVNVEVKNSDGSAGEKLFQDTLARGETRTLPRRGPLYITANPRQNLEIEILGRRWPMPADSDRVAVE